MCVGYSWSVQDVREGDCYHPTADGGGGSSGSSGSGGGDGDGGGEGLDGRPRSALLRLCSMLACCASWSGCAND